MNEIRDHTDRTGLIVENDHGAGSQAAAHFLHFSEVHGHIQMLLHQKIGRGAAGQRATKPRPVAHSTGVFFKNLAHRGTHRQFP